MNITDILIKNTIECTFLVVASVAAALCQRWLLGLSTWKKDLAWLQRQPFWDALENIKWYQGIEAYHQARAWKLLQGWD